MKKQQIQLLLITLFYINFQSILAYTSWVGLKLSPIQMFMIAAQETHEQKMHAFVHRQYFTVKPYCIPHVHPKDIDTIITRKNLEKFLSNEQLDSSPSKKIIDQAHKDTKLLIDAYNRIKHENLVYKTVHKPIHPYQPIYYSRE
jgi:hypothetical protein